MLEFLLGRSGVFADTEAEHRYINQLREAAGAFDHLQSRRCGKFCNSEMRQHAWLSQSYLPVAHLVEIELLVE